MKYLQHLTLSLCVLSLTACQTWNGVVEDFSNLDIPILSSPISDDTESDKFVVGGNCPTVKIVDELSMMQEFTNIDAPSASNLVSDVNLTQAESNCSYSGKSATVDIKLAFEGRLGPKARARSGDKPFFSYPFFVAVTAPDGTILAKEVFSASMTYESGQDSQTYYESMRQIIPIANAGRGHRYKILVGFQIAQDQLNRNRAVLEQQNAALKEAAKQAKTRAAARPVAATSTGAAPATQDTFTATPPIQTAPSNNLQTDPIILTP